MAVFGDRFLPISGPYGTVLHSRGNFNYGPVGTEYWYDEGYILRSQNDVSSLKGLMAVCSVIVFYQYLVPRDRFAFAQEFQL
jgi:hypothetical protein